jgi:hypothetical protein
VDGGLKTQFPFTYSQAPTLPTGGGVRTEEVPPADFVPEALTVAVIHKAEGVVTGDLVDNLSLLRTIIPEEKQSADGTNPPNITRTPNATKVDAATMLCRTERRLEFLDIIGLSAVSLLDPKVILG